MPSKCEEGNHGKDMQRSVMRRKEISNWTVAIVAVETLKLEA
jgi:hypothetical protein